MSSNSSSDYLRIDLTENATEFIANMQYSKRHKILEIQFLERYDKQKVHSFFDAANLQKSYKDLRKKIGQRVSITDSDFLEIEETILNNIIKFEAPIMEVDIGHVNIEPAPKLEISFEEWQKILQEKYQILIETTFKNFSDVWQAIEFSLSVKNVLHIQGNTLPFIGVVLGPPSSSKTLALEMLRKLTVTFYTDNFTAKSFVSHNTSVSQEQLAKIDMLPKIKNKLFITPELAPLFSGKDEDLLNILGIVTRIADGHGYESDSGAYGHRGYNEGIMFAWIGAAVEIPRKVYKHLSVLGPKLYFIRMVTKNKTESDYLNELKYGNFDQSKEEVEKSLLDYLKWFDYCPVGDYESSIMKVKCESSKDDDHSLRAIIKLGELLARLRGFAQTWETHGTQGSDYGFSKPNIENPSRAITNLRNLARGHALSKGRLSITFDDIPLVIRTVLSTAPIERVMVFDLLLNKKGKLTTTEIETHLNVSGPTASRTMTELKILGLVVMRKENENVYNSVQSIHLKNEFKWFLSDEFKSLREGFNPEKFVEKEKCKEKSPPPTLKKYDDGEDLSFEYLENIAWIEFKQIEANELTYEKGFLVVEHTNLRNAILRNPDAKNMKITEEAADILIDKLLESGMLSKIREGWYYRTTKDNEDNAAAVAAS